MVAWLLLIFETLTIDELYHGGTNRESLVRLKNSIRWQILSTGYSRSNDIDLPDNYNDGQKKTTGSWP